MNPGVYDNISNAEYHSGPGESKSLLDLVAQSPAHYRARELAANDNQQREPTPAQMIGTAFHALLLEPAEFVKDYCLALRPQDVPDAIDSRDQLVAMVAKLNEGRLPKLSTSGAKPELVARILAAQADLPEDLRDTEAGLLALKADQLKSIIEDANASRPGLLPDKGTMAELAATLRMEGVPVTLWSDVKAEWLANNGHRQVLTAEQLDQLHRMRDAVMAHPAARALLTAVPGVAERSVYWTDPATGLLCRCRPDFWRQDGIVVDLKTTEDASVDSFARSVANWRYHVQHPFYLDGLTAAFEAGHFPEGFAAPRAFIFLAVEKDACVVDGVAKGVAVYVLDDQDVKIGRAEYQRNLVTIADCRKAGRWPGYGDKIQPLALPAWVRSKAAEAA